MKVRRVNIARDFPTLQTLGLAVRRYPNYVNLTYRSHTVDVLLLSFVLGGEGWHMMGQERYRESGTSLGITLYGQEHDIVTGPEGMDVCNIYLQPSRHRLPRLTDELEVVLSALLPLHAGLGHKMNRRVRVPLSKPDRIRALLTCMEEELDRQPRAYEAFVQSAWRLLLIEICRDALATGILPEPPKTVSQRRLEAIRALLDRDFSQPHELGQLAKRAGMSKAHFCRAFRDYTGKPPIQYLIERRLQHAMYLLLNGDKRILDIALTCGFNDLSHFNRKFRELTEMSPRDYRKRRGGLSLTV